MTSTSVSSGFARGRQPAQAGRFCTTRWTCVRLAKDASEDGRQALADLCDAYYLPVVTFLRCELRDPEAARDLAHAFFARLLDGGAIHWADPQHGRFRSYLLGAVKHFLSNHRAAAARQKRGGGLEPVAMDDDRVAAVADTFQCSPDGEFDRQWAVTVITRALEGLRGECVTAGRESFFDQVKPWLMGEAPHGGQAALAESLGMSTAALKMAVQRLKGRFRQRVKDEVAGTLDDPAMIAEEMRSLFTALGG